MKLYYDFHIHSVLSMCASDDMTPCNITAMAALAGYGVIAVADHNSSKNCAAAIEAGAENGVLVIPAMELCTCEEVHVLCLFEKIGDAMRFSERVRASLPPIPEKLRSEWRQHVMDASDAVIASEDRYLHAASDIGLFDAVKLVAQYGGIAAASHIDRPSHSITSNLGFYDRSMGFSVCEVSRECDRNELIRRSPDLAGMPFIVNSDAHDLETMYDPRYYLNVKDPTPAAVIKAVKSGKVYEDL